MAGLLQRLFQFLIFSSLFIGGCALLMVYESNRLLHLQYDIPAFLLFVFFSTVCSYNFHWYLTPDMTQETMRISWTKGHKQLHLIIFLLAFMGAVWYFFHFIEYWYWLAGSGVLTFLYTAPKIPLYPFPLLRKVAVGKTLFLTFVWTYVTTVLPAALDGQHWNKATLFFCLYRFFFIYAICIIFDYRDRQYDRKEGIRSMITYFNESGINRLFYASLLLCAGCVTGLYFQQISLTSAILLLAAPALTLYMYPIAKKDFSDYLYYFVLDGLMAFSAAAHLLLLGM